MTNLSHSDTNFKIRPQDVAFALTINRSEYKRGVTPLIGKIAIINKDIAINFNNLSHSLNQLNIGNIDIYSIHSKDTKKVFQFNDNNCKINYVEIGFNPFTLLLNTDTFPFFELNKNALYIFRDADYIDVKNLINKINNNEVNIGRGASQKAHLVSPLEFRFVSYLMAICDLDSSLFSSINSFNYVSKERYLVYTDNKK